MSLGDSDSRWLVMAFYVNALAAENKRFHIGNHNTMSVLILGLLALVQGGFAQAPTTTLAIQAQGGSASASSAAPLTITLQDALQRARLNDPQYRSALTDLGLAREDRVQARAGLLPSVNYNNSFAVHRQQRRS
jgi:outer membrane protein TolC